MTHSISRYTPLHFQLKPNRQSARLGQGMQSLSPTFLHLLLTLFFFVYSKLFTFPPTHALSYPIHLTISAISCIRPIIFPYCTLWFSHWSWPRRDGRFKTFFVKILYAHQRSICTSSLNEIKHPDQHSRRTVQGEGSEIITPTVTAATSPPPNDLNGYALSSSIAARSSLWYQKPKSYFEHLLLRRSLVIKNVERSSAIHSNRLAAWGCKHKNVGQMIAMYHSMTWNCESEFGNLIHGSLYNVAFSRYIMMISSAVGIVSCCTQKVDERHSWITAHIFELSD